MFTDNGEAFKQAAFMHLHSAMALVAAAMETMEPEKLIQFAAHLERGARPAIRTIAPCDGEPPALELGMWHPEAGWLTLHTARMPMSVGTRH